MKRKQQLLGLLVITGLGIPTLSNAQKKDSVQEKNIEETVLLGSRGGARSKTDSPVPVDVFNLKKESIILPQSNINQILNIIAPSFTSTVQTAADGTDHLDPLLN